MVSQELKQQWLITSLTEFHYTNQSQEYHRYDNESDAHNYHRLVEALEVISFGENQIQEMMGVIVGILHLGNIRFESSSTIGDDVALFSNDSKTLSHVEMCCQLFGLEKESFLFVLTNRGLI